MGSEMCIRDRLGLMQQDKVKTQAECEVEIDVLREEVAALQNQCSRLQDDLDKSRRNSSLLRQKDHDEDNDSLRQTISQITRENESLKDRNNELTLKLFAKEEDAESRQKEMQYKLDQRDLEIFKLTTENRSMLEVSNKSDIDLHSVGDDFEEKKYYEEGDDDVSLQNLLAETVLDSDDNCLLYTSPSPRDLSTSRMPSSA